VVPFSDIIIHSTVLAADGRRMSKSLGTGVDPLQLIDRYGADATRYGLLKMSSTQDVRFAEGMIDEGLRLANKLYNASRLILLGAAGVEPEPVVTEPVDAWMLARLDRATEELTELIDAYDFSSAVKTLYRYVWNEVCDWYLEACKARLQSDDQATREAVSKTLLYVLDRTLRLVHPVMPHITEELWRLAGHDELLLLQSWPKPGDAPRDADAEAAVGSAFDLVGQLRQLRGEIELPPRARLDVTADDLDRTAPVKELIEGLAFVSFADANGAHGIPVSSGDLTLRVIDQQVSAQLQKRLSGRLATARDELERAEGKLANERFVSKAKPELVEAEREKVERFSREVADYERRIADLGA
jgi:valyl-tRNA synthetase